MQNALPTELYISDPPGSPRAVEDLCTRAANRPPGDVVAVALDIRNVSHAADLLADTNIGIVSMVDPAKPVHEQARLSMAHGASEIAIPSGLLETHAITALQSLLGPQTPLTVELAANEGVIDLSGAERSLTTGADFVSFRTPGTGTPGLQSGAALLALAAELELGGVKLGAPSPDHRRIASVLHGSDWAMREGNARLCVPNDLQ